ETMCRAAMSSRPTSASSICSRPSRPLSMTTTSSCAPLAARVARSASTASSSATRASMNTSSTRVAIGCSSSSYTSESAVTGPSSTANAGTTSADIRIHGSSSSTIRRFAGAGPLSRRRPRDNTRLRKRSNIQLTSTRRRRRRRRREIARPCRLQRGARQRPARGRRGYVVGHGFAGLQETHGAAQPARQRIVGVLQQDARPERSARGVRDAVDDRHGADVVTRQRLFRNDDGLLAGLDGAELGHGNDRFCAQRLYLGDAQDRPILGRLARRQIALHDDTADGTADDVAPQDLFRLSRLELGEVLILARLLELELTELRDGLRLVELIGGDRAPIVQRAETVAPPLCELRV